MAQIYRDRQLIASLPASELESWFKNQKVDPDSVKIEFTGEEVKTAIRDKIHKEVADPESLLGTTADAATLALYSQSVLIDVFAEHGSKAVKAALKAAMDGKLVALSQAFRTQVESGEIILPALAKGVEATAKDIATRSTGVARILAGAINAKSEVD